jgi:putative transposase
MSVDDPDAGVDHEPAGADPRVGPLILRHPPGIGGPAGAPAPTMYGRWPGCRGGSRTCRGRPPRRPVESGDIPLASAGRQGRRPLRHRSTRRHGMDHGPRRKRLRLAHHDYGSPGAYFVTMCTHERARILGAVTDGEVRLNEAGQAVSGAWTDLPAHHPNIRLDEFVVMPDHLHGIVVLRDQAADGTDLPDLIRRFKSLTTARWRRATGAQRRWQRGYRDRVVRDDDELGRIRRYIEENPQRWAEGREGPAGWDSDRSP